MTFFRSQSRSRIPGFGFTLGFTLTYLSLLVLIPLSMLFIRAAGMGGEGLWHAITSPRALAALTLSFTAAAKAALINVVFGFVVAWVLERYTFPGKGIIDAVVDLPFALPTAVAGISLTSIYSTNGWMGSLLLPLGIKVAYTPLGIIVAMTFIGLPFVVRTIQPVLADLDQEVEEAASSLGASRWKIFWLVLFPPLIPACLTGFAMAFARALGEYGSIVFISGNMPLRTEIAPLLIMVRLEEYDYTGATALAATMLTISFFLLLGIHLLQWWSGRRIVLA